MSMVNPMVHVDGYADGQQTIPMVHEPPLAVAIPRASSYHEIKAGTSSGTVATGVGYLQKNDNWLPASCNWAWLPTNQW